MSKRDSAFCLCLFYKGGQPVQKLIPVPEEALLPDKFVFVRHGFQLCAIDEDVFQVNRTKVLEHNIQKSRAFGLGIFVSTES